MMRACGPIVLVRIFLCVCFCVPPQTTNHELKPAKQDLLPATTTMMITIHNRVGMSRNTSWTRARDLSSAFRVSGGHTPGRSEKWCTSTSAATSSTWCGATYSLPDKNATARLAASSAAARRTLGPRSTRGWSRKASTRSRASESIGSETVTALVRSRRARSSSGEGSAKPTTRAAPPEPPCAAMPLP